MSKEEEKALDLKEVEEYYKKEAAYGKYHRKAILKWLGAEEVNRLTSLIEKVGGAQNLSELDRLKWRGAGYDYPHPDFQNGERYPDDFVSKPDGMRRRWRLAIQLRRPKPSSWAKPKPMARNSGMIGDGPRRPREDFNVALKIAMEKTPLFMKNATIEQLEARIAELKRSEKDKKIEQVKSQLNQIAKHLEEIRFQLENLD